MNTTMNRNSYQVLQDYGELQTCKSHLRLFYLNARSIRKKGKFDELKCILRSLPNIIHVILLTETWISSETQALELRLNNYTHYYNYRTDARGGGVSAYIHNDLKHSLSESQYLGGNNYLWIQLEKYKLEIGVIYKPGHTNFKNFIEVYDLQLQQRKRAIVFGDFNIDLLTKDDKSKQYRDITRESGYVILNKISKKYCTRECHTKKSILDHVSTNLRTDYFHMAILDSPMSDHKQIYLEIKKTKPPPKLRMQYEAIDYIKLYKSIEITNFDDTQNNYELLESKIKLCTNESKVTKTKILNSPQKDWIDKNVIAEINRRNVLWTELKKNLNDDNLESRFQSKRMQVAKFIQETKDSYYYKEFTNCYNKPKKMWNLVNTLANNKIKQRCAPPKLLIDSKFVTEPNHICQIFNNYFATIGSMLANEIPKPFHDENTQALPKTPIQNNYKMSQFKPCTEIEIMKIIDSLDPNCSTGLDGINTKAIKCIKVLIANPLTKCFNKLLHDGEFPDSLKMARVTPIFKSGSTTDPGNYRPISVLPVISKILEKILYNRLEVYLDSINFISDRQYGFRPKSNTLTATIDLVTKIKQNIDSKKIVVGIFIDLKKAFDTVSHKLLLKKLESLNISGSVLKMFESYLKNRSQVVKMDNNNYQSSAIPITCGVPQGSILGPLLFLIYINNINEIGLNGHITLYADDTCLFYFGSSMLELIPQAQNDLNTLSTWFQYNLLTINIAKTCYIVFKAKNKIIQSHDPLTINNIPLQQKNTEKYLGLRMDSQLTWNTQIDYIRNKLSSLLGSLRNIVRCIPRKLRYTIYNTLVKPHLMYLIEIWGSAAKTKLANLQIIQNKIIKMLFNYPYLTATSKIYEDTKIMNIRQLYTYNVCIFVRKALSKTIHTNITLKKYKHVTKRSTRRASLIVLPKARTNYGKKTITFEGVQLFNKVPSHIKNVSSHNAFKYQLAQYLTADLSLLGKSTHYVGS